MDKKWVWEQIRWFESQKQRGPLTEEEERTLRDLYRVAKEMQEEKPK